MISINNGDVQLNGVGNVEVAVRDVDSGVTKIVRFSKTAKKLLTFTDFGDTYQIPLDYYIISGKTKLKVADIWAKKITKIINKFGQEKQIELIGVSDTVEYGETKDLTKWFEKNYIVSTEKLH